MKVYEYIPLYGLLFNFDYQTGIEGKPITVNEMFDNYPDFELNEVHLDQLYFFDLVSLQTVLKDEYFNPETVVHYLRELFDTYRVNGGNPFEWLHSTFESVNLNPQNYRKDLITTIEKALIEWIEIFEKQPIDYLYLNTNPETLQLQPIEKQKPKRETPKTFEELFYNTDLVTPCIDILKELDPPLIDTDCNYIGKLKGVFCVWIDEMQRQGIVKHYSDRKIFASLIPQKIKRFSIDESMFGKYQNKAENLYRTDIKTKVSKIKLSQNSH